MKVKIVLLSAVLMVTPAIAQETTAKSVKTGGGVRAQIEKIGRAFMDAAAKKDAKAIGEMYHSHARMLPGGSPPVLGRAAIEKTWQSYFDAGFADLKLQTESAEQHGDVVVELGSYTATLSGKPENGKFVVVYKEEGGQWKLWIDSFSSNAPPPAAQ